MRGALGRALWGAGLLVLAAGCNHLADVLDNGGTGTGSGSGGGNSGGGGGGTAVDAGAAVVDSGVVVAPEPSLPRYVGRWAGLSTSTPRSLAAGAQIVAAFEGTAMSVDLDETAQEYIDIVVDGGSSRGVFLTPGVQHVSVAAGLPAGRHEVRITRRNETVWNSGFTVRGYDLQGGSFVAPPARRSRYVQFIGDSNSVGFGMLPPHCVNETWNSEDHARAFPSLVANAFDADEELVARAGIGLSRNADFTTDTISPIIYDWATTSIAPPAAGQPDPLGLRWGHTRHPDFVFILLGQNDTEVDDNHPMPTESVFRTGMRDYVAKIHSLHPASKIVVGLSPNLLDSYYDSRNVLRRAYQGAVADRVAAGDTRVRFYEPTPIPESQRDTLLPYCWHHFGVTYHAQLAEELKAVVSQETGWTPVR